MNILICLTGLSALLVSIFAAFTRSLGNAGILTGLWLWVIVTGLLTVNAWRSQETLGAVFMTILTVTLFAFSLGLSVMVFHESKEGRKER